MLFNSFSYLVFLVVVVSAFWLLTNHARRYFLLWASLFFYCWWDWRYGFLIGSSIVINYVFGLLVATYRGRVMVVLAVASNLVLLFYFKYLEFLVGSLNAVSRVLLERDLTVVPHIVLPIGISFFTFQGLSYVIDVARGQIQPSRRLFDVALYLTFWPHLIAGPIVRAGELIPQFFRTQPVSYADLSEGLRLVFAGLFLKVFLADNMAGFVEEGFLPANYMRNSALDNWTLAVGFGWQIYFDFAAYSMIAQGSARLVGVVFPDNFNFPYVASSPREFWLRWHITLSSWIRDYLYVPLQGLVAGPSSSRGGIGSAVEYRPKSQDHGKVGALVLTWMLMGLWHGANWTFLAWGLWHAGMILLYRALTSLCRANPILAAMRESSFFGRTVGWALTCTGVMVGWLFFRAPTLEQAFIMIGTLVDFSAYNRLSYKENFYLLTFLYSAMFFCAYAVERYLTQNPQWWLKYGWLPKSLCYAILVTLSFAFLRSEQQFIYFQF